LSQAEREFSFTRIQALQLFQSIPSGKPKADYYLVMRGITMFSPVKSANAILCWWCTALKLIEPLLALQMS